MGNIIGTNVIDERSLSTQCPRFRGVGQSPDDAPEPDGRIYQSDALCRSCKKVLTKSSIIFGSKIGIESHKLSSSLDELKRSAIDLHCHLCALVLWVLVREASWEDVNRSRKRKVTMAIYRTRPDSKLGFTLYCQGLTKSKGPTKSDIELDQPYLSSALSLSTLSLSPFVAKQYLFVIDSRNPALYEPGSYSSRDDVQTLSEEYMERARYWMRECEAKHSNCKPRNTNFMPTRIVHVGTWGTLVPIHLEISADSKSLNQERRYCSLSHRWTGDELVLKNANVGAMMKNIPLDCLSKATRDAILITRHLGLRYLWVDTLCIVQDSHEDWTREAATMAHVYENSVCTIAAAGEATVSKEAAFEARNPLIYMDCRIAGSSEDGIYVEGERVFTSEGTIESKLVQHHDLLSRGWVYQEQILSPKIIFFGDREVLWSCQYGKASEERPDGSNHYWGPPDRPMIFGPLISVEELDRSQYDDHSNFRYSGISCFRKLQQDLYDGPRDHANKWYSLVCEYSSRKLSQEEDRLIALSGLAQRVQERSGWKYLAGLWQPSLLFDLLWYQQKEATGRGKSYIAPTWSWASVGGAISYFNYLGKGLAFFSLEELVEVVSAETETHPLDKTGTGKVTDGTLVVRGYLKDPAELPYLRDWDLRLKEKTKHTVEIYVSHGIFVGIIWLDVDFCDLKEKILLMPMLGDISVGDSSLHDCIGLVLTPKIGYCERIGLFWIYGFDFFAHLQRAGIPEWLLLGEKERIVIK